MFCTHIYYIYGKMLFNPEKQNDYKSINNKQLFMKISYDFSYEYEMYEKLRAHKMNLNIKYSARHTHTTCLACFVPSIPPNYFEFQFNAVACWHVCMRRACAFVCHILISSNHIFNSLICSFRAKRSRTTNTWANKETQRKIMWNYTELNCNSVGLKNSGTLHIQILNQSIIAVVVFFPERIRHILATLDDFQSL